MQSYPLEQRRLLKNDGRQLVQVLQGGTFTVPDSVSVPATLNPLSQGTTKRTVGGHIYAGFHDQPGQPALDLGYELFPRDTVAISAVAAGKANLTINGQIVYTFTTTDVCGVLIMWS